MSIYFSERSQNGQAINFYIAPVWLHCTVTVLGLAQKLVA